LIDAGLTDFVNNKGTNNAIFCCISKYILKKINLPVLNKYEFWLNVCLLIGSVLIFVFYNADIYSFIQIIGL